MGWYFYKRLKVLPGVWINLSKSGATLSTKAGPVTLNVGRRGVAGNLNVGGGLRWRENQSWGNVKSQSQGTWTGFRIGLTVIAVLVWVFLVLKGPGG